MTNDDWPKVRAEAERQGWEVRETKNGFQLMAPDGGTIVTMDRLHRSSSPYALAQTVRRMKAAGFRWPVREGR